VYKKKLASPETIGEAKHSIRDEQNGDGISPTRNRYYYLMVLFLHDFKGLVACIHGIILFGICKKYFGTGD